MKTPAFAIAFCLLAGAADGHHRPVGPARSPLSWHSVAKPAAVETLHARDIAYRSLGIGRVAPDQVQTRLVALTDTDGFGESISNRVVWVVKARRGAELKRSILAVLEESWNHCGPGPTACGQVKVAVDIEQEVAAGGGALHADCEAVLLKAGSRQVDVWGADWIPSSGEVRYEALINIRPSQNNSSMTIQDPAIRAQAKKVVEELFGGV